MHTQPILLSQPVHLASQRDILDRKSKRIEKNDILRRNPADFLSHDNFAQFSINPATVSLNHISRLTRSQNFPLTIHSTNKSARIVSDKTPIIDNDAIGLKDN